MVTTPRYGQRYMSVKFTDDTLNLLLIYFEEWVLGLMWSTGVLKMKIGKYTRGVKDQVRLQVGNDLFVCCSSYFSLYVTQNQIETTGNIMYESCTM